jgi:hypothetical protein
MTFALPPRLSDRDARVLAAFLDELATAATTGAIDHSTVDAMTRALHLRGDASVSVERLRTRHLEGAGLGSSRRREHSPNPHRRLPGRARVRNHLIEERCQKPAVAASRQRTARTDIR